MSETKLPRLLAAAKEFNIGQETLIEFLSGKGFSKDELKPSSKLSEDMYRALQTEFQGDKAAKQKSDQVDLPKGSAGDAKKKKEEEEPVSKKEEKPAQMAPPATEWPVVEPEPAPQVTETVIPEPEPVVIAEIPTPVAETPAAEVIPVAEAPAEAKEILKVDTPEIEGPKVVGNIDLSAIDSSTRPKKVIKKKNEATPADTPTSEPVVLPEIPVEPEVVKYEEAAAPTIENIKAEKIEGPKVLGKIELPVEDNKPRHDEKRKRKRIPIEKKGTGQNTGQSSGPQGGGHGQGPHHGRKNDGTADGQRNNNNNRWGQQQGGNKGRRDQHKGGFVKREDKQIDEKEIQEKIRETQAKLSGGSNKSRSNLKAKQRREKRGAMEAENAAADDKVLQLTEFISVSELASLMDVSFAEVIGKCMGLGIMVSINQRLDAEVIELVAGEFGYEVEFIDMEKQMEMEEEEEVDDEEDLESRSPIVTIMGHVDHGKTSLLDYIRNANVVAGEAGGITQHIGAYQVELANGKEITFLDTPGHEAFTAMRARGAKVTDIAVIVVAADDAVMPQTREAISHAQAAGVPMIFAINKIDKDGANPTKIYEQLSQMNILVEEWGGKYQSQEIAAKKGLNIDKLLEKILLEAELLNLQANPKRAAVGTIIEASLDKGRGYVATVLVENGTLKAGDIVVSGQHYGRVKAMFDERNHRIENAGPTAPAVILGLNGAPQAGEKFKVFEDESEAKEVANRRAQILREQGIRTKRIITLDEIGRRIALGNFKELNVIIKGDVDGSVEALSDSLQKLSTEEIAVKVLLKGVGQISESDVVLATASDAVIIGFNVRPSAQANRLADTEGVEIKLYSIIYTAIDEIKSAMEGMLEPKYQEKIVANVEIREVYKFDKATVAGCFVQSGKVKRDSKVRLIRDGIVIYPVGENATAAELGSLKRFKDDAKEVVSGMECGLTIKNYNDIKPGDIVEAYEQEEVKRTL